MSTAFLFFIVGMVLALVIARLSAQLLMKRAPPGARILNIRRGVQHAISTFNWFQYRRQALGVFGACFIAAIALFQQTATHAASLSLNIDLQPLFDNINIYLPIFFLIFAIPGAIVIAMLIAKLIINSVRAAFEGGKI